MVRCAYVLIIEPSKGFYYKHTLNTIYFTVENHLLITVYEGILRREIIFISRCFYILNKCISTYNVEQIHVLCVPYI